ncbi:fibrillarin [Theileria orientalis strain Shintoku]|uniref:Fibrillarin n=1 Tax=Theileria orientalis strain Shintoku TaxID=869250 RepID=J4C916_THEOR|nr:fibrillarin [Theileria orientalis strain Shintoku]PVC53645.1 fibrillarin [Theileria orientalis]BAM41753.1 fibrillarin [Theileria orientalis strain Shintoku]|eukprot:XP_009692054.1 fibrillarin [Theileria orientalis strain Shintoku]
MSSNEFLSIKISVDDSENREAAERNLENLDFDAQRNLVVNLITSMNEDVRERDKVKRDKSSHPLLHIKLSTRLESQLISAMNHMEVLKKINTKLQSNKKKKLKYTDGELMAFEDTINNLNENLLNLENAIRYRSSTVKKSKVDLNLKSVSFDKEALTMEEQNYVAESIKRWNERDQDFDNQLKEIGEAVDRIGEVAINIGARAQEQAKNAINTVTQVENTTKGISDVTLKIKKLLGRQRMMECYVRFILIVLVLVLAGILMYMVIKKLRH